MHRALYGPVLLLIFLLLTLGRVAGFPISIFIVAGGSMSPTLKSGDIVLAVSKGITNYDVGDIVVWYGSPGHGVIHRVVNITKNFVITKGDANPLPDPPIAKGFVMYKVVGTLPREIWGTAALVGSLLYVLRRKRTLEALSISLGGLGTAVTIMSMFLVAELAVIALVGVPYPGELRMATPHVDLRRVAVSRSWKSIHINYSYINTHPTGVSSCLIQVGNTAIPCMEARLEGTSLNVRVPRLAYVLAYRYSNSTLYYLHLKVNITFDKGWVYGVYAIPVNWRPLSIMVLNRSIVIYNPNPVRFNLTILKIAYEDWSGERGTVTLRNLYVDPRGNLTVSLKREWRYAYIVVMYHYKFSGGGLIVEAKRVDL